MGHTAIDCYHRMNFTYQGRHPTSKLVAMASSTHNLSSNYWISDTGATDHFTPDLANIQHPTEYTGTDTNTVGNGNTLPITHIDHAQLRASKHLFNLRHTLRVPNMKSNLLSVYKCCKDNNCSFHFDASKFSIHEIPSGKVLYKGLNEAGLYPIHGHPFKHSSSVSQFNSLPPVKSASVEVRASNSSASTWHSRLGHPHVKILSHVFNKMSMPKPYCTSTNLFCKHCILGKMTQLPFSTSCTKTTAPLQLVHSDVWGPALVTAYNGTKYYVSFIDDFSRFTWFFPLKHKSEVLPTFIHFKSTIEYLLSCKLKIIRTDCGGEYTDTAFQNFCSTNGIFHQFSCPHTY